MKREDRERILAAIARLKAGHLELRASAAEELLMEVLTPLLTEDGYDVRMTRTTRNGGLDFLAKRLASEDHQSQTLGIEFKYYRSGRPVCVEEVRQLFGAAMMHEIDRAILLVNTRFTKAAWATVRRELPLQVELLDLDALRTWTDRLKVDHENLGGEVREILRVVSRKFAKLIAEDPRRP